MSFFKNKTFWLFIGVFSFLFMQAGFADEGDSDVFLTVTDKLLDAFQSTRTVIFVVGGFGLVGLAVGAIFGKVNWKWFASLAIGLVIVAVAGAIITYATGSKEDLSSSELMGDTLTNS